MLCFSFFLLEVSVLEPLDDLNYKSFNEAVEVAQWVKVLSTKHDNWNSIARTHIMKEKSHPSKLSSDPYTGAMHVLP